MFSSTTQLDVAGPAAGYVGNLQQWWLLRWGMLAFSCYASWQCRSALTTVLCGSGGCCDCAAACTLCQDTCAECCSSRQLSNRQHAGTAMASLGIHTGMGSGVCYAGSSSEADPMAWNAQMASGKVKVTLCNVIEQRAAALHDRAWAAAWLGSGLQPRTE